MKGLFLSILALAVMHSHAQTVFSEVFNEAANSTTGADAIGPTAWTTICTYCDGMCANPPQGNSANDYIKVVAGELAIQDSNGPAVWETADFDISACTEGITISCDIRSSGDLEMATTGCNQADAIKFEVSYDGGTSWIAYSDALNGYTGTGIIMNNCGGGCLTTCAGTYPIEWCGATFSGPLIGATQTNTVSPLVDIIPDHTFSDCASVGISNTMRFRAQFVVWSSSEQLFLDDVLAVCSNCALPVEVGMFEAKRLSDRSVIDWRTLSESSNKKFRIQRSTDGFIFQTIGESRGQINSMQTVDYQFIDTNPINQEMVYYRLEQVDMNGKRKYSDTRTVYYQPTEIFYNGAGISINFPEAPNQTYTVNIYDLSGALIYTQQMIERTTIPWDKKGFFIVEIPELEQRKKLVTQ